MVDSSNPGEGRAGGADPGPAPSVPYWHVWVDQDGVSHQDRCIARNFVSKTISAPAAPQWQDQVASGEAVVLITVQPVGWTGTWHENPKPQWIIPLSGRWFVETMDGHRVEMGPGDISFGQDQGTRADGKGHKGHLSGTVGDEPAVLMVVQLASVPKSGPACWIA